MTGNDLLQFAAQTQAAANSDKSDKSPTALRTISEVSDILDVPQHVLRFWETKFNQIAPLKRNGGRRFYRPEDIEVLQQIKFLLYKQGYTIKGAKKAIEDYAKIVRTTSAEVGKPNITQTASPANSNDNHQAADTTAQAGPNASNRRVLDVSLDQAAIAAIRADLIDARNSLATKLGKEAI